MVLVPLVAGLFGGCRPFPGSDPGLADGIEVRNQTAETLSFEVWAGGERFPQSQFGPGEGGVLISGSAVGPDSLITENGCTTGDLVALDADGAEVARRAPPLCVGEVWIVEEEPPASP